MERVPGLAHRRDPPVGGRRRRRAVVVLRALAHGARDRVGGQRRALRGRTRRDHQGGAGLAPQQGPPQGAPRTGGDRPGPVDPRSIRVSGRMSGTSESPVVVGVDGSQAAQAALRWAIDYARCVNAPVHAVAVLAQPLVASDGVTVPLPQPMWDADLEDRFEAEAERWLANALPAPYADEPIPAVSLSTI